MSSAMAATQAQQLAMAQTKLQQIVANTGSAEVKAKALLMGQQLKMQMIPLMQQVIATQAGAQSFGLNSPQGGGLKAGSMEDYYLMKNDKEYGQNRVIVGDRVYRHTGAPSDANTHRIFEANLQPVLTEVNRLKALGPAEMIPGTPGKPSKHSWPALTQSIAGDIKNNAFIKNLLETAESLRRGNLQGYQPYEGTSFKPLGK